MATNKLGIKGLKRVKLNLIKRLLKERTEAMLNSDLYYPKGSWGYERINLGVEILNLKITVLESF